ncbi:MAG: hypothetical protein SGPRY_002332 [Prymnesium sp.]
MSKCSSSKLLVAHTCIHWGMLFPCFHETALRSAFARQWPPSLWSGSRIIRSSKARARCEATRYCQRPGTQMGVKLAGARSAAASSTWSKEGRTRGRGRCSSVSRRLLRVVVRENGDVVEGQALVLLHPVVPIFRLRTSARSLAHNLRDVLVLHGGEEGGMIPGAVGLMQQLRLEGRLEDSALLDVDSNSGLTALAACL